MADTYEQAIQDLQPPPLQQKPRYLAFMAAFGQVLDEHRVRCLEAARLGVVEAAPVDALDLIGKERLLPRFPSQDDATYRDYLSSAFSVWSKSGTKAGLEAAFSLAFPGPTWVCKEFKSFPTDPLWNGSSFWSQFLMEADPATPYIHETTWGSGTWGSGTWGSDLTEAQVELFKRTLRQWKGAYTTAAGVRLVLETSTIVILPNPQ